MRDFKAELLIDGEKQTLVFRSISTPGSRKYFVSAFHKIENRASFEMKEHARGQWKVVAPAPWWALRMEQQLSAVIVENNRS